MASSPYYRCLRNQNRSSLFFFLGGSPEEVVSGTADDLNPALPEGP